jgi:hypothetical protein
MAFYADSKNVQVSDKPDQYSKLWKPGETPPAPGIFKCQTCGFEDVINRECTKLPPCSACGKKKNEHWKMLVKAVDK